MDIGTRAVNDVMKFLMKNYPPPHWKVENVSTNKRGDKKNNSGFDIKLIRGKKVKKIEVKGSTKENGIPDAFQTEFDKNLKLIADYIYVVRYKNNNNRTKHKIYVIKKSDVDRYTHQMVYHIKISNKLKKDLDKHPEKYKWKKNL